jgi:serine/threonine protein kinase
MVELTPCPEVDTLEHFALGSIEERAALQVEEHLSQCCSCLSCLGTLRGSDQLIEALRAQREKREHPEVNETVCRLMARLKEMSQDGSLPAGSEDVSAPLRVQDYLLPPQGPGELGRLGDYRVLELLGAGGMGAVFLAEDLQLRRRVALKVLHPHLAARPAGRKRFQREARAAAAMTHDHLVAIYQVGEGNGLPFIALQYLEGETLQARLEHAGPLPPQEVIRLGRQLASGLAAAHRAGLVHRDIKPANIFLASAGRDDRASLSVVKILDFGLAWSADEEGRLTDCGTMLGTPPYMSPEQARGEAADVRSDLHACGAVLYAMCTGRAPFAGQGAQAILEQVRTIQPRSVTEINPTAPAWLAEIIDRLLAKNPAERCTSAEEVAALLDAQSPPPSSPAAPRRRRRWLSVAGLAVAVLLLAIAGPAFLRSSRQLERPDHPAAPALPENNPAEHLVADLTPGGQEKADGAASQEEEEKAPAVHPAALFAFEERGTGVKELGSKVADLLFARLSANPDLYLVDRADIKKVLEELELGLSGAVKPAEATKVGQLTGAKLLITGSVVQVDKKMYLIAKIIGTETSRVLGVTVDGKSGDDLGPLVEKLGDKVSETIKGSTEKLIARHVPRTDRIAALNKALKKGPRPSVLVQITERHIGLPRIDPAAQTEVAKFCKETGFTLIDPEEGTRGSAEILITGEGMSETALRVGNLISVKARVEIKAVERKTGKLLAADRQTTVAVGLAEQIAGKSALQEAGAILAERLLPRLVK